MEANNYFPLSQPQMRIWYSEKLYPNTSIGVIAGSMRIKRNLDLKLLEQSVQLLFQNHDTLRLRITEKNGRPVQYIYDYKNIEVPTYHFINEEQLDKWANEQTKIPFDIFDNALIEAVIFTLGNYETGFYVKMHHLISDAWTMTLIGDLILKNYFYLLQGKEVSNDCVNSYKDFVEKELMYFSSKRFFKDKEYWSNKFSELPEKPTTLTYQTKPVSSLRAERLSYTIENSLTNEIQDYCKKENISTNTFFLSVLTLYLQRITEVNDISLLTSVHNRTSSKEKNLLGMFISTLPFRVHVPHDCNFSKFIKEVEREQLSTFKHQRYPFNFFAQDIRDKHKTSIQNYFKILYSYQNSKFINNENDFKTRWYFNGYQEYPFIIHINDREERGQISIDLDFWTEYFSRNEIDNHYRRLYTLICDILRNPFKNFDEYNILPKEEQSKILYDFNQTSVSLIRGKTLTHIFEEQVKRTPNKIAYTFNDTSLTYKELNIKANQLANLLRTKGVGEDSVVGIFMERSLDMIIGIFGILKAGGAYLPIMTDYPKNRIDYILKDSKVKIVLTHKNYKERLDFFTGEVWPIDILSFENVNHENPEPIHSEKSLAYVIYTSGSTGNPKGVMIEHHSVINRMEWMVEQYQFTENETILQKTPYVFDVSVWELFIGMFIGARVCLLGHGDERDPRRIIEKIAEEKITIIHFVPSMLSSFLDVLIDSTLLSHLQSLKFVFCSGEALQPKHVSRFNKLVNKHLKINLVNLYGPTEATIEVSSFHCPTNTELSTVPIGKPIQNVHFYIIDTHNNLKPIGVPGELCISGKCLARGYMNNQKLTEEKFIPNPFLPNNRMYKTGDLAMWLPDGNVEYLGRIDHQVKIRGHRIELGEIESRLSLFNGIMEVVVLSHSIQEETFLVAYLVTKDSKEIDISKIIDYLRVYLPDYMIPTKFVFLKEIPLTINGKVDRKQLQYNTNFVELETKFITPITDTEKKITSIWCEVLGIKNIGVTVDFFDLGGHSLLATRILLRIKNHFGLEISLKELLENSNIRKLAKLVDSKKGTFQIERKIKKVDRSSRIRRNEVKK
ncbi:hypothetical protein B6A27_02650 [Anoxybacillus sp. UARK-01]|uniref:non-ribosomal peptide synthetase n=1 Tax=Anoxybacillus sp. UARK-01 TaxID=1895648 RepID=UPI0009BA507F|nr:non-ribosomal peptide synthetase [Anoxybacillus sp. UARK-01]OQM47052.1 hypothetical protein B6A27_02650 [Anoxybacillus sp. UARK-01]